MKDSGQKMIEGISVDKVCERIRGKSSRWAEPVSAASLPEEILHDILLRLPPETLITCTAVRKSWRSAIQSSAFIKAHLRRATAESNNHHQDGGVQVLLKTWGLEAQKECYSLYWDASSSFSEYSKFTNPFIALNEIKRASSTNYNPGGELMDLDEEYEETTVVGTCNGIVCLCASDFTTFIIWNPCIRKFVILPPPPSDDTAVIEPTKVFCAFGYDSESNDYKVLRSVRYSRNRSKAEVWSLASGSWKSLSKAVVPENFPHGVLHPRELPSAYDPPYVNGAVHWLPSPRTDRDESFIVSFDMSSELFGRIALPKACFGSLNSSYSLLRHGGSLAFFENHGNSGLLGWVMKEYGAAESWVKLLTISPQEMSVMEPLAFRNNGELVLVLCNDDGCGGLLHQSVDVNTKRSNDFWKSGYCIQFMESFVQSVVLLDQPNSISG